MSPLRDCCGWDVVSEDAASNPKYTLHLSVDASITLVSINICNFAMKFCTVFHAPQRMEPTHIRGSLDCDCSATVSVTFGLGLNVLRNTGQFIVKFNHGIRVNISCSAIVWSIMKDLYFLNNVM